MNRCVSSVVLSWKQLMQVKINNRFYRYSFALKIYLLYALLSCIFVMNLHYVAGLNALEYTDIIVAAIIGPFFATLLAESPTLVKIFNSNIIIPINPKIFWTRIIVLLMGSMLYAFILYSFNSHDLPFEFRSDILLYLTSALLAYSLFKLPSMFIEETKRAYEEQRGHQRRVNVSLGRRTSQALTSNRKRPPSISFKF